MEVVGGTLGLTRNRRHEEEDTMTKTIELKTIVTADEPDRAKKYTSEGLRNVMAWNTPQHQSALHYVEGRGWTWGYAVSYYSWEDYVDQNSGHFPLEELEPVIAVKEGQYTFTDVGEDKIDVNLDATCGAHRIYTQSAHGSGFRSIHMTSQDLVTLRDFLNEHVTVTEG